MITKIKQLFSDTFAFAIVTLGNKMVSFLLIPIFTRYLKPELYGIWDITNTITMLVTYICILGTDAAFAYYFFDVKKLEDKKSYFSATVYYSVGVSFILLLIMCVFSTPFASLVYHNHAYSLLTILAFISTVEAILIQHLLALARYKRKIWTFNILSMGYWIGASLLNVIFVMKGMGVEGILWGQIIAGATTSFTLLIIFRNYFTIHVKKEHLINLLKYGIPIVPSLISIWIMSGVSRIIIFHFSSPADAGIYGAALRFASFIALITSTFQLAWRPFSMSIKDREDAPLIFSIIARTLIILGTLAILVLTFFIKPIMLMMTGKAFYISYPIIWVLSLSTLLNTMYIVFSVGLLITKKTKSISTAFLIGPAIFFTLNILFVPIFSYTATAVITLITYLFIVYFVYFRGQKHFYIPFKMGSISAYLAIYLASMSYISYLQINNTPHIWAYNTGITLLILFSIFATRVFSFSSLGMLREKLVEFYKDGTSNKADL